MATFFSACGERPAEYGVEETHSTAIPTYSAAQFFETTSYGLVPAGGKAFSPDGRSILMSSDETGVFNSYELPVSGGKPIKLTDSSDNAMFGVSWFPDDKRILYTYDSGGNELNHVVVREVEGSHRDLTPGDKLKAGFLGWSDDGKSFYLVTTERNQQNFDVYRYSSSDYERQLVFENPGLQVSGISGDERWLVLDKPRTSADSDIYIVDLMSENRNPVLISEHEGNVEHNAFGFTPDNRYVTYATNEFGEFSQAWKYNLESGEKTLLVKADWDVWYVSYSPGGRYRVSGVNADARTVVTLTELSTGTDIELPDLPPGDLNNIRYYSDDFKVALIVNADNSPSNIHFVDLEAGTSTQLTDALNPAIDPLHLVSNSVIRYESFDGLEIPGILYKPHNASPESPAPALVWVHGGPGGQSRTGYSATIQHLVNHGFAVLAANNRGSSGYGKTFNHLDDRHHGEEDLQDIVHARRYLESLDWVDSDSVGIIGGSYGGYMVAAALAFEPEVFDVGVNIFGVTNWVRTLESIPPWWEDFKKALYDEMGDPAVDAERHRRISPLFHAKNIVKPLLVVQGANDPRVLQVESDELVAAVQANEVPVEYLVFPDEGHGFRKRENRIAASEAYVQFLNTYLRSE
ncbi:MAG: S9 family peptidase [Gammaproteobacteria bacterium]|nr:S9 family peptidase [Gammaproteobacteria bacterium]